MTDIILNQRVPGGVMKQLGDAAGGVTYDQYAPGGCVGQLYAASGLDDPLDQYAPGGAIGQIEQEIEGGGGGEAWPPAGALIAIDFVNDRAWNGGDVAIDTLLGTDAATTGFWGTSGYNPAFLTEHGYVDDDTQAIAFIGAAKTLILGGCTFRIQTRGGIRAAGGSDYLVLGDADGSHAVQVNCSALTGVFSLVTWGGSAFADTPPATANDGSASALNAVACTLTSSGGAIAANGSAAVETDPFTPDDWPAEGFVAALTNCPGTSANGPIAIQSITLYAALPDTSGLSELSEV